MREILFRGKRIDNGEWTEGYFVEQDKPEYHAYIIKSFKRKVNYNFMYTYNFDIAGIFPETIGQYTGLRDKNGTRIFEGDIVRCYGVKISAGYWVHDLIMRVTLENIEVQQILAECESVEIIGNIYDNPELLEEI